MNITERVIREQFSFWEQAPSPSALPADGANYAIVGCGTSYYLAQIVAAAFNRSGRQAIAVPGAEWARRRRVYRSEDAGTTVVALSRSGESSETVQAVEVSRAAGLRTIAVTCEPESSIVRAAETSIVARTHPDEGIVMTSSASLMLIVGLRLSGVAVDARQAAVAAAEVLDQVDAGLSRLLEGRSHFVYLGAGALHGLAQEGALKLQEMSLSYSQAFHTMEYRHGPISLVDAKTFAVLLYNPETRDEEAKLTAELRAKGAVVAGFGGPGDLEVGLDDVSEVRALVALPALQILGERVAELRGLDTVAPRHLSKVVVLG
ncbi:MAG: SIS domain-containing protein [Janthinobacterium lividum]